MHGITLIAFIGSVFSPYYAWQRRSGPTDPANHCAFNVALYGPARCWAMTERGRASITRSESHFTIGPSGVRWDGNALVFDIRERTMPFAGHVAGQVRVTPLSPTGQTFALDPAGQHRWSPLSPRAHVEVTLTRPSLRWSGLGYLDSNDGDVPLEKTFASWTWSRAALPGATRIFYDVSPREGEGAHLALHIDATGEVHPIEAPPTVQLPKTGWRISRETRAEGQNSRVIRTLEDTPFYARSELLSRLGGQEATTIHESLSLDRFAAPIVQAMLPFKMPRRA